MCLAVNSRQNISFGQNVPLINMFMNDIYYVFEGFVVIYDVKPMKRTALSRAAQDHLG